ncbi:ly6/PLAUR domain-containing protein 2-like [Pseudorasbora parva]|uniref:ly6/PLAUR domain-containing protein 2-like n=1 Tax=Pseudorasbora parva TaxID=51549 RepID=UPI00351EBB7B
MDLQISVFLLFVLFTAGHSLDCYECMSLTGSCANQTVTTCPSGFSQCESSIVTQVGEISSISKYKACTADCLSMSMNIGITRTTTSCCNTNLCNAQDAPDPGLTGKKCYYCDGQSCSKTMGCSGIEDRCIKATGTIENQSVVLKGCVSKSICNDTTLIKNVESISCCEGNLCNGAQSVTQSFLFLCCSLLSYFLLH